MDPKAKLVVDPTAIADDPVGIKNEDFRSPFHTEPVGKYLIAVCTNIACMLQGAYELLEHIEERLAVAPGGTTADGLFSLEEAECLTAP